VDRTGVPYDVTGGPEIELADGSFFSLLNPTVDMIDIEHIAHATSQLCRFTGHCSTFYSVAQHCVIVSHFVPPELALTGLLHDATEAYIGDVSRPLKDALDQRAPGILEGIENQIHQVIGAKYGHPFPFPPEIKQADNLALAMERRDLMVGAVPWPHLPDPPAQKLTPWEPLQAEITFLARFAQLTLKEKDLGEGGVSVPPSPSQPPTDWEVMD
jgi:hypothetical protein